MHPQQARLLLPQLRLARIILPVFGTSHIYANTDNGGADRDLDGVEFCDAPWLFDAQPGLPNHADIATRMASARDSAARLFAFGMDAWSLMPYIRWMRNHPDSYLPGATGQLAADHAGYIHHTLVWARFRNGQAQMINGSLESEDRLQKTEDRGVNSSQDN
jgi:outer membrane PBP1 activator LpoA protein